MRLSLVESVMQSDLYRTVRGRQYIAQWRRAGCPAPPPQLIKAYTLCAYARRFGLHTLVETGTYHGDTSWGLRDVFDLIYTIELHPELAARARHRFRRTPHIHVIEGDSATVLPSILTEAAGPILFWLDGHYSGAGTARSDVDTPVLSELTQILARPHARDVVLIDDARSFTGQDGYPSLEQLRRVVTKSRPSWSVQVHDDIIRIDEGVRV